MSSKKRIRSQDSTSSNWSNGSADKESKSSDQYNDRINGCEHEFLAAFEKPTQIYRYLRTRQLISPIFLNRSLTYMRHRLNRSNIKRRRDFSVDSLLEYVILKKQKEAIDEQSSGNLSVTILNINNEISNRDISSVVLETSLLKMGHQKRKDVMAPIYQFLVGKSEIKVNDEESGANTVTIYKNELNETNGHIAKQWSYSLLFMTSFSKKETNNRLNCEYIGTDKEENRISFINDLNGDKIKSDVPVKRRRLDDLDEMFYYKCELAIFDKHKQCLLTDGEYKVVLQPCSPPKNSKRFNKYNRMSSWQEIDANDVENLLIEDHNKQYGSMEVFRKGPVLRLRLSWSSKPIIMGLNPILLNDYENDSGIGNNMSDNSSLLSYNGLLSNACSKTNRTNCLESVSEPKRRIIYQFLFNNNARQQTKPQNDMCCPWCSLNCQRLYALIKHLKLCHNRFTFNYVPQDNKTVRIDVSINECYDGSYAGNPHDLSFSNTGFAFSRNGPVRRNPVTHVVVCRPKRFPHSLSEFDEPDEEDGLNCRVHVTGHNRLYYHTNSCLPIRPQEMDFDSEAENDPQWLKEKTQLMIDEFTDVNEGEKEVMKMWNLHIMRYGFVGDCQIHLASLMFVEDKGLQIIQKSLYKNFVLHLNNLYDFGLLNASSFVDVIKRLDQKVKCSEPKSSFGDKRLKSDPNPPMTSS